MRKALQGHIHCNDELATDLPGSVAGNRLAYGSVDEESVVGRNGREISWNRRAGRQCLEQVALAHKDFPSGVQVYGATGERNPKFFEGSHGYQELNESDKSISLQDTLPDISKIKDKLVADITGGPLQKARLGA